MERTEKLINFALEIYKEVSRQIEFADKKAFTIIMANAIWGSFLLLTPLYLLTLLNLIPIILGLYIIYPRYAKNCDKNCNFWAFDITCSDKFEENLTRFKNSLLNMENTFDCISKSVVITSNILKKKYHLLNKASILTIVIFTLEALIILLVFLFNTSKL